MKKLELLAPAKKLESGIAAINSGADAVYIGAPKFGARAAAGNSLDEIEKLVQYAHKYWVKVYITVNTLLYDDELLEAEKLIWQIYEIGVDAVIIQDLGIFEMNLPPIQLFASTQTHNYDIERIKFLESLGFSRIILARELSLDQIKGISENTNVDLEFFVHGALCVSYSGQCYFSEALFDRSANRGECAQICRQKFSLEDSNGKIIAKDKYLLSLKDLNLSKNIADLINSGISSFKIEGRLKDIDYIKNVVAFYRKKLDSIIQNSDKYEKASSGKVIFDFEPDLEKTFNRSYTDYFLNGENKNLSSFYSPKSLGKYLGEIISVKKDHFEISTKEKFISGDGICFQNEDQDLTGMYLNKIEGRKIYSGKIDELKLKTGTKVFRNYDYEFSKVLDQSKSVRKIEAKIFVENISGGYKFVAVDEDKNQFEILIKENLEIAKNPEKYLEVFKNQLQKSGSSIFEIYEVEFKLNQIYFLAVSKINEIRRNLLDELENLRIKNYPEIVRKIEESSVQYFEKDLTYKANVLNKKSKKFYLKRGVEKIEPGFELLNSHKDKVVMTCKYCIKDELEICPLKNKSQNLGVKNPLFLFDNKRKYKLIFDCKRCEMSIVF